MSYPLLRIHHSSQWMLLFLIPTFYGCWLYSLNRLVAEGKSTRAFLSVAIAVLTILLTVFCVLVPVIWINRIREFEEVFSFLLLTEFCRLLISIGMAVQTFDFEKRNALYSVSFKPGIYAYVRRITVLHCWWFGIFSFQQLANVYSKTLIED